MLRPYSMLVRFDAKSDEQAEDVRYEIAKACAHLRVLIGKPEAIEQRTPRIDDEGASS